LNPQSAIRNPQFLQPRVSWDRVHNRLLALPGSQQMALLNGGTIPDTGQYAAYAGNGVRIGELDEEFIYERRVGDVFLLGTNAWRLDKIEADRVRVSPAEGAPAMVPFWRGERGGRTYDLGRAIGEFLRELRSRLDARGTALLSRPDGSGEPSYDDPLDWLQREFFVDVNSARNLVHHVRKQLLVTGSLPTDQTLCIEAARDQLGDWQVILLSPLGGKLHFSLRLVLEAKLRQRLGYHPQCLHHNDGILIRLTDTDEPILDLFTGISPDAVEGLILDELADSALFALRFRQNAARSLLLPRGQPGKRAPLWLQRLRGRDLLQVCRKHPDFPIVVETFRECLHDHLDVPRLQQLLTDVREGRIEVKTRRAETPSPFASALLFSFTAAQMYNYDDVEPERGRGAGLDQQLLQQLVSPEKQGHLLDPRAVHNVERRLRGLGQPPRTATEMAEWLRRLGDLTPAELEGPMAAFLEELQADGRALLIELPRCREPRRWIAAEDEALYRDAFAAKLQAAAEVVARSPDRATDADRRSPEAPGDLRSEAVARSGDRATTGLDRTTTGDEPAEPQAAIDAGTRIFERFLATHALVGLGELLDRYPFEEDWARRQLEEWARSGRVVPVQRGEVEPVQWSAPANLDQVQRGSLALLRREVVTCAPPQFAEFLLRWQGVHPETRHGGAAGLGETLDCLQGLPLPAEVWEQTVLPARAPGYQPRWLDEWISGGSGVWVCQGDLLAFFHRETLRQLPAPTFTDAPALDESTVHLLDCLRQRGASFLTDLAADTELSPSVVRAALGTLMRRGLATNDHFDVIRRGDELTPEPVSNSRPHLPSLRDLRRRMTGRPEGRWSLTNWGRPEPEMHALTQAALLLQRYGIVARELALLDPWLLPWRVLYEVLSRMELAGDVRRGYFVEGLSGAQFALPEAAQLLQDLHLPSTASAPLILLHSMDPANLYGSGAPFDIALLDGGTRPLLRRAGNWLVLRAGRPLLLVEQQGKKLTALPSASRDEIVDAVKILPSMFDASRGSATRHKLTVDEWNGRPVTTTEGRELLEAAGFVRDYQGMTLYAAWR
jgi:ATP-dependent Lhr-like helicase